MFCQSNISSKVCIERLYLLELPDSMIVYFAVVKPNRIDRITMKNFYKQLLKIVQDKILGNQFEQNLNRVWEKDG